jgi:hypothetical protein
MDEFGKLKILLKHWIEHNDEHAEVYKDWAKKAMFLGNEEVSKILEMLYQETGRLNRLIEKAIEKLEDPNVLKNKKKH